MATIDSDKYKELFEYMKDAFSEESDRYKRLEEKAIKYLSSITIAVTAFVLLLRWSLDKLIPANSCMDYVVIILSIITLLSLSYSWYYLFISIKLQTLNKMPSGNDVIEMFKKNKIESVHLALAKRYSEGTEKRASEYMNKLNNLQKGYSGVLFSGVSFMVYVFLLLVHSMIST